MHRFLYIFLAGVFALALSSLQAQESVEQPIDSVVVETDSVFFSADKSFLPNDSTQKTDIFKPNPTKVLWMGAVIPGYGQILNRQYWKVPIVYAGFLGCAYAVSWTGTMYQNYKMAYRDIIDKDPNTNTHIEILPPGYTIEMMGGEPRYTTTLKTRQDQYRRYRDISVMASIAYYGLTILEAYVAAQLYDFDISPDLSMTIKPTLLQNQYLGNYNSFGMQLCFNLK